MELRVNYQHGVLLLGFDAVPRLAAQYDNLPGWVRYNTSTFAAPSGPDPICFHLPSRCIKFNLIKLFLNVLKKTMNFIF